ncbi:proline-, glutamic acid- and leucine-rich protein 1-like [Anoplophora glabripennis]|uniref:proline-, glutamic acid- and leucine-rich protein 1-like n=1 Tax=Anoplophora glabripennis TaxID=217634 RepID=UPI000873D886|nr:proline-, glutamic acid- and leucine-rich protein 1-like [Anoplophora glabripennis]XP_018570151.1 proline-, glutamic acid- and leucine-rich protein 1-like [Anoplophora glabripennis]
MNSSQIEETLKTSDDGIKSLLSTILNINLWNESNEKIIITAINKMLAVSKTRLQGLELLNLIINNCSPKIISENGNTWISHCLVKYAEDDLKELKLTTIGSIVDSSHEEQEFSKKFISEYVSKVFETCLSIHNNHEAALNTLATCIKYYGSWFAPHKLRVEHFITNFLENPSEQLVGSAATAFHYLQQVGGAGIDGINHKRNFSTNFSKLCVTVQKLFDKFFENEIEIDQSDRSNQEAFEFTDLPHYTQKMLHITTRRLKNCLTFIIKMLLKGFPAEKEIKPSDVLDVISRGTAVHRCLGTANDNSLEDFQFSILLNQVQIELLRLLQVLIVWLHGNALPFTFTITKILVDCLKRSQSCQCYKTDSLYQERVYKALGCWIRVSRGALHTHFQTQLVKCILKDVTPVKNSVSLNLPGDVHKNKSKKAIQKAVQDRIISSGQGNRSEEFTNTEKFNREKNCLFALNTLKHLLSGTILKLHPNTMQELYKSIINTLIDIQISETSHPYTNRECEAELYEVFVTFYEQDTLKTLPPLQLTIDVLNRGINSTNRTIALTCEHGLSSLEKICRPVCPSMFISEGTTPEQAVLLPEDKSSEDALEDMRDVSESGMEEATLDTSSTSESEGALEKGEADEEIEVKEDVMENGTETSITLEQEPSVHIIDMQIIKSSAEDVESDIEDSAKDTQNGSVAGEQIQEGDESLDIKREMLNQNSIQEREEITEFVEDFEPPLKRIRGDDTPTPSSNVKEEEFLQNPEDNIFEEESLENKEHLNDVASNEANNLPNLKQEQPSQNLEDDIFEEGSDFVDAVKDY